MRLNIITIDFHKYIRICILTIRKTFLGYDAWYYIVNSI